MVEWQLGSAFRPEIAHLNSVDGIPIDPFADGRYSEWMNRSFRLKDFLYWTPSIQKSKIIFGSEKGTSHRLSRLQFDYIGDWRKGCWTNLYGHVTWVCSFAVNSHGSELLDLCISTSCLLFRLFESWFVSNSYHQSRLLRPPSSLLFTRTSQEFAEA